MVALNKEFYRKIIHLSSLTIPLTYRYMLPLIFGGSINAYPLNAYRKLAVIVLSLLASLLILVEIFRLENKYIRKIFNNTFGLLLRKHENKTFTGSTYLLISSLICISLYLPDIAFVSLCFLALGDTFAALMGKVFGKRKFIGTHKSLEGSIACFISTFVFSLFFLHPIISLSGASAATLAEISNFPLDDNIKIPIFSGAVMSAIQIFI